MLILTRRENEAIFIGDNIVIKVMGVDGHRVKIGVEAPRTVQVDREEVLERKQREGVIRKT